MSGNQNLMYKMGQNMGQKDMIHVSYPNYESYIVSMMQSDMELHHFWFSECVILRFQSL